MILAAGWLESWEREVMHLATCRWHRTWFVEPLRIVQVWEVGVALLLVGIAVIACRYGHPRGFRTFLAAGLGVAISLGIGTGLWHLVRRDRPQAAYVRLLRTPEELATCADRPEALAMRSPGARSPAFPSHHALTAATFATCLWLAWRPLGVVAWIFALLVGFGRLHSGKHWPTDVLAGFVIGALVGWALWRAVPRLLRRMGRGRWNEPEGPGTDRATG